MRDLLVILFMGACSCLPSISKAQDPPKGSNQIIVKKVSFDKIVIALLDSGFQIKEMDKDFKTLLTKPHGDYNTSIYLRVKDSTAYLSGEFYIGSLTYKIEQHWYPAYKGNNWFKHAKPMVKTFEWLDEFAHSLSDQVTYSKQ